jgi:hypothetical protein
VVTESWRVAQIVVGHGAGAGSCRGSGYLVAPGVVLTAAHVLCGASAVHVRLDVGRPLEIDVPADTWWANADTDLAVVVIPDGVTAGRQVEVAQFGRAGDSTAVLSVQALGFPRFKLRSSAAGAGEPAVFRDLDQVTGHTPVAANRRQGTLAVYLDDPAPATEGPAAPSPWEGMSGAAVWADGRIIGVVAEHHPSEGTGRLTAQRIDRVYGLLPESDLHQLATWLGLPPGSEELPNAVLAGTGRLVQSAYLEQVRDIAPDMLIGRDSELAQWAECCASADAYTWWQAGPWSGKSALASWFVTHPPAGVDIVSFFITGRLYGQADSDAFLDAMIEQLDALDPAAGESPPAAGARVGTWLSRLAGAASHATERGRRLAVVVDGLDEDVAGASPSRARPSIAALLPRRPPPGARFVITSRPGPGIPDDVPSRHPLRTCAPRRLPVSQAAEDMERRAKQELQDLLTGDDVAVDVVGCIAGSGGGLTRSDLSALTGAPPRKLDTVLRGVSGRSLQARVFRHPRDSAPDLSTRVYLFAHETLRATAEEQLGSEMTRYRELVHDWVRGYGDRGWPDSTPAYAVRGYPRLLAATSDVRRLIVLARDPSRHTFLLQATGSDYAGITEIREAQRVIAAHGIPDLQALVELAVCRHAISIRNQSIPADLPAVWARLGRFGHAEALARVITDPRAQAQALAELVTIHAQAGNLDRAEAVARIITNPDVQVRALSQVAAAAQSTDLDRATRLASDAEALAVTLSSSAAMARTVAAGAVAAARSGDLDRAEALTRAITNPEENTEALTALVTDTAERGDLDRANRLSAEAETAAHAITDPRARARVLADLAVAVFRAADLDRANRLSAEAETAAHAITDPRARAKVLTKLITASARIADRDRASRLAIDAEAASRALTDPRARAQALSGLVIAIARTGHPDHATRLAADAEAAALAISEPRARARALTELAGASAQSGDPVRAKAVARIITAHHWRALALAAAAAGAARAGDMDHAESVADLITGPGTKAQALTTLAAAAARAGDTDRSSRLAARAEDLAHVTASLSVQAACAELAAATARAGNTDSASRLATQAQAAAADITDPLAQPVALAAVVAAIAQAGHLDRAEVLARSITRRRDQARALAELVPALAQAGALDHAETIARALTDPRDKAQALTALAVAADRAGDSHRADAVARAIADPRDKARAFAAVAAAAAQAGDLDRALTVAGLITGSQSKGRALAATATAAARAGDLDRAETVAGLITGRRDKGRALAGLVPQILKAGDLDRAQMIARTITDPRARSRALSAVAVATARAGDPRRASQLADEGEAAAGAITDSHARARALAALAAAATQTGDLRRASRLAANAEALAGSITGPDIRTQALAAVAAEAAQAAYLLEYAEAAARAITDPRAGAQALAQVAAAADRAGNSGHGSQLATDAEVLAQAITDPDAQAEALAQLAISAGQNGDMGRARHLLAVAVSSEAHEIRSWAEAVSRLFPEALRNAGEVFLSAYKSVPRAPEGQASIGRDQ